VTNAVGGFIESKNGDRIGPDLGCPTRTPRIHVCVARKSARRGSNDLKGRQCDNLVVRRCCSRSYRLCNSF
jgi:hypothetical protein